MNTRPRSIEFTPQTAYDRGKTVLSLGGARDRVHRARGRAGGRALRPEAHTAEGDRRDPARAESRGGRARCERSTRSSASGVARGTGARERATKEARAHPNDTTRPTPTIARAGWPTPTPTPTPTPKSRARARRTTKPPRRPRRVSLWSRDPRPHWRKGLTVTLASVASTPFIPSASSGLERGNLIPEVG